MRFTPQFYYLKQDTRDGFYFTTALTLAKRDFPVYISSIINKTIETDIIGSKNFVWNISLTYSFNKMYVKNRKHNKSVSLWEMSKVETIEQFYKRKFDWVPDDLHNGIGHFNVFQLGSLRWAPMPNRYLMPGGIFSRSAITTRQWQSVFRGQVLRSQKQA